MAALCLNAMHALGALLLFLAAALLFEELTFGGLVRLLLAPRPRTAHDSERNHHSNKPEKNHART